MLSQEKYLEPSDSCLTSLHLTGGAAAILAAVLVRRNLGVEIALFHPLQPPAAASDWFTLLQDHRLLGLAYLGIFDILNYILVGLMLAALYGALRRFDPGITAVGVGLGMMGITVYAATNTALSLLSLSDQYAAAASDAQKTLLLGAGQALLSLNRFSSPGAHPGSGGYLSLLLVSAAGGIFSIVQLRSRKFHRLTAWAGILANGLDLVYCLAVPFAPASAVQQLGVLFLPAAGLFFMVWHLMTGWELLNLWRRTALLSSESLSSLDQVRTPRAASWGSHQG